MRKGRKLNNHACIGVIGGMGPTTSVHFYDRIIGLFQERRNARYNYEFPEMVVHNVPSPDNVSDGVDDALCDYLLDSVALLERAGADFITIPCNSAHIHIDAVMEAAEIPVLNILEETVKTIKASGIRNPLILGTWSTLQHRLYDAALERRGINYCLPIEDDRNLITQMIMSVCDSTHNAETTRDLVNLVARYPQADAVILGCTELPQIATSQDLPLPGFDTLEILAQATFQRAVLGLAQDGRKIEPALAAIP